MPKPSIEHEWDKWATSAATNFMGIQEEAEHRDTFYAGFLACLGAFSGLFESKPDLRKQDVALLIVDLLEQADNSTIPNRKRR